MQLVQLYVFVHEMEKVEDLLEIRLEGAWLGLDHELLLDDHFLLLCCFDFGGVSSCLVATFWTLGWRCGRLGLARCCGYGLVSCSSFDTAGAGLALHRGGLRAF